MATRKPKCPICKKDVDKNGEHSDSFVFYKNRYYHGECYETIKENVSDKKQEEMDRQELNLYIAKLYNVKYPSPFLLKQVKDFREDGYTYKGMYLTLKYFYETLGNKVKEDTGIGIIPYMYEKTTKFYIQCRNVEDNLEEINDKINEYYKTKVIKVKNDIRSTKGRENILIDISKIGL